MTCSTAAPERDPPSTPETENGSAFRDGRLRAGTPPDGKAESTRAEISLPYRGGSRGNGTFVQARTELELRRLS